MRVLFELVDIFCPHRFLPLHQLESKRFLSGKKPVNGATSIFEYYFQQSVGISIADVKMSDSEISAHNCPQYDFDSVFHAGVLADYKFADKDIEDFATIQRKYIHLHPTLERKINRQIEALLNGGQDIRGPRQSQVKHHLVTV